MHRSRASKTRQKSSAYHHHGKHKEILTIAINKNKEKKKSVTEPMFSSVKELMEYHRKRR